MQNYIKSVIEYQKWKEGIDVCEYKYSTTCHENMLHQGGKGLPLCKQFMYPKLRSRQIFVSVTRTTYGRLKEGPYVMWPTQVVGSSLVNSLINAYGLFSHMSLVGSSKATYDDLVSFHSSGYISFLQSVNDSTDLEKHDEEQVQFGLGYDCPLIERMYDFARVIVGSSVSAAKLLVDGSSSVAINWCGGWHHAQRDEAEGFCYVNDIVIAIHWLLKKFDHVLYIDLDIHHGNGVENAFSCTNKVFTLSLHLYEPGFYPGTGSASNVGCGKGKYYTANVPLKDGIGDSEYFTIFDCVSSKVVATFRPQAVVVQCGADCLSKDPLGSFNLTPRGLGKCVQKVLSWDLPTLFLGGGGYNLPNTARCWTYLTSVIVGQDIPSDIPDHAYFIRYEPDFELHVTPGHRRDHNDKNYIDEILQIISKNLDMIS